MPSGGSEPGSDSNFDPERERSWDPKRPFGWELPDVPSAPSSSKTRSRIWQKMRAPIQRQKHSQGPVTPDPRPEPGTTASLASNSVAPTGIQLLAINGTIAYVFLRLSFLHEFLAVYLGAHLYLIVLVGGIAYLGLLNGTTWRHAASSRLYWYWLGFSALILVGTPFSTWPGGSANVVIPFVKDNFLCLPLIAGVLGDWRYLKRLLTAIAIGGVIFVALTWLYPLDVGGRLGAAWTGSTGNPNDLAGHLVFLIPFMLFAGCSKDRNFILRLLFLGTIPVALFQILRSSSRGAFIGLIAGLLFTFIKGNAKVRASFLILVPVVGAVLVSILPTSTMGRLFTFTSMSSQDSEAVASYQARRQLLLNSIDATLHHPFLGVGAGQFGDWEGQKAIDEGHPHSNWQETHNSYTEVSSEDGVPAVICFVGGTFGTLFLLLKIYRTTKKRAELKQIAFAAFLLSTSMAGFCVAIFFLNFAYKPYLCMMTGLAIALQRATAKLDAGSAAERSGNTSHLPTLAYSHNASR